MDTQYSKRTLQKADKLWLRARHLYINSHPLVVAHSHCPCQNSKKLSSTSPKIQDHAYVSIVTFSARTRWRLDEQGERRAANAEADRRKERSKKLWNTNQDIEVPRLRYWGRLRRNHWGASQHCFIYVHIGKLARICLDAVSSWKEKAIVYVVVWRYSAMARVHERVRRLLLKWLPGCPWLSVVVPVKYWSLRFGGIFRWIGSVSLSHQFFPS